MTGHPRGPHAGHAVALLLVLMVAVIALALVTACATTIPGTSC